MKIAKKAFPDKGSAVCFEAGTVDLDKISSVVDNVSTDPYIYPIDISHFKSLQVTAALEVLYPTLTVKYSGKIANQHVAPPVSGGLVVIPTAWENDRYFDSHYQDPADLNLLPKEVEQNVDAVNTMKDLIALVFDAETAHETIDLEDLFPAVFKSGNETCIGIKATIDGSEYFAYYRPTSRGTYLLQTPVKRHV